MIRKITWALAIVLGIVSIACEKDVLNQSVAPVEPFDPDWGSGDTIKIESSYYIRGKIDSQLMAFQDTVEGYIGFISAATYADSNAPIQPFGCDSGHSQRGQKWAMRSNFIDKIEQIQFEFVHCMSDTALTPEQLSPFYVGSYPFGRVTKDTLNPGIRITYMDKDSVVYRSDWGSGALQGAYFHVSDIDQQTGNDTLGGHLILKGSFETNLYSRNNRSIPIEAGDFRIRLVETVYP